MLTDEEKQRILNEEVYRQEVRLQIEKKEKLHSRKQKLWVFLNSAFGLWFLSSVAVGFIAWSYTQWAQSRQQENTRAEQIRKLDTEISSRLQVFEVSLNNVPNSSEYSRTMRLLLINNKNFEHDDRVFAEFEDVGIQTLLIELLHLVPESEKPDINKASKAMISLAELNNRIRVEKDEWDKPLPPELQSDFQSAKRIVRENLKLQRWENADLATH